jgi:hypothetical protein
MASIDSMIFVIENHKLSPLQILALATKIRKAINDFDET